MGGGGGGRAFAVDVAFLYTNDAVTQPETPDRPGFGSRLNRYLRCGVRTTARHLQRCGSNLRTFADEFEAAGNFSCPSVALGIGKE